MFTKTILLLAMPVCALAQNVGIGIQATKARFEMIGSIGNTVAIFGGDGAGISVQQNTPAIGFNQYSNNNSYSLAAGGGWVQYLNMANGSFNFDAVGNTANPNTVASQVRRITIRQNGNVSVNATEANATLFVGNPANGLPAAIFRGTNYNSMFFEQSGVNLLYRNTYINGGKPGSLVLINDKLGGELKIGSGTTKVGINTDPTDIFEIKQYGGRGFALINPSFAYWELFVEKNLVENAGDLYVYYKGANLGNFYNGDGKYYSYSDQRVKKDIQPLPSVLPGMMTLRPCTYEINFDNPAHLKSIGLIAQEARAVFPEITQHVTGDDLGYGGLKDLYTMDYNALGPLAIRAIQEQQQIVDRLKGQVSELKKRIEQAERMVHKLP